MIVQCLHDSRIRSTNGQTSLASLASWINEADLFGNSSGRVTFENRRHDRAGFFRVWGACWADFTRWRRAKKPLVCTQRAAGSLLLQKCIMMLYYLSQSLKWFLKSAFKKRPCFQGLFYAPLLLVIYFDFYPSFVSMNHAGLDKARITRPIALQIFQIITFEASRQSTWFAEPLRFLLSWLWQVISL